MTADNHNLNGAKTGATRAMFYCHDTFGLGHLRRTLALADHFQTSVPGISQLIVTGSPVATSFTFPENADFVKLPSVTKNASGVYEPRSLPGTIDSVVGIRRDMLLSIAGSYHPDLFIVDHAPAGLKGEAIATLRHLKRAFPNTKLVVGLRDIMDEAATVRRAWARDGSYELLDEVYDQILVYGNRNFYDVVAQYGFSSKAKEKTRFVGYLGRTPGRRSREDVRAQLGMQSDKLVVVTAGGGGDGRMLYDALVRDLQLAPAPDFDLLIIGGPLLSRQNRADLLAQLGNSGNVHFIDFTDDLPSYLGAADAVISMGGYNTICEILSLGCPAIIVPRITPRKEQLIRATILRDRGLIDMIHPDDLAPRRLLAKTLELLKQPIGEHSGGRPTLRMDGLGNTTRVLKSLLYQPMDTDARPLPINRDVPTLPAIQHPEIAVR